MLIFDTFDFIENRYYNSYFLFNFVYHPYGELVDGCHQNNFKDNFMFYMFDFNQTKYYWIDNYQNLGNMNDMKISKPYSELTNLTERINNINLDYYSNIVRNETNLKNDLTKKLDEYKTNYNNLIRNKVDAFEKRLNYINNQYYSLRGNFLQMTKYFNITMEKSNTDLKKKVFYENYLDCSKNNFF